MQKSIAIVLFSLLLTMALTFELYGDETNQRSIYVEHIQQIAETMEVFPIDLIAREGPLSCFRKGSFYPIIGFREELDSVAFEHFYDFCQLAFDAGQREIDECVDYLPHASAKEKALILTVFYIYAYPWEKQKIVKIDDDYHKDLSSRSWMSIQYPCDAFDLTIRKRNRRESEQLEILSQIVAKYTKSDEIAFQSVVLEKCKLEEDRNTKYAEIKEIVDSLKIKTEDSRLLSLPARKDVIDEIRRQHPNSDHKIISDLLYVTYWQDLFSVKSELIPSAGNTSDNPKTLGQIAQELQESWGAPQKIDDLE